MEKPTELVKAFTPLSRRINEFETIDNPEAIFDDTALIQTIDNKIDGFDFEAVLLIVTYNYERIQPLLKRELSNENRKELIYYSKALERISKPLKALLQKKLLPQPPLPTPMPIELPINFTVKQLTKHFDPPLSPSETTLFLYYLKEKQILPPYTASSLGKLAEALFVRNQKTITTNLADINSLKKNKSELEGLKKILLSVILDIENDIKDAK